MSQSQNNCVRMYRAMPQPNIIQNGIFYFVFVLLLFSSRVAQSDIRADLSFDMAQRVACQTVIEDIRWSHRIWPQENRTAKPARSQILSDARIRAKVEDNLRMESALEDRYGIRITDAMLQAELKRIAGNTRDPQRLRELFAALGNDPVAIAECLVRPQLVQKKLYNAYVWDKRQHGELKAKVEAALANADDESSVTASGGKSYRIAYVRQNGKTEDPARVPLGNMLQKGLQEAIELDADAFARKVRTLTASETSNTDSASTLHLHEMESAFVRETLLNQSDERLEVQVQVWEKTGFNQWWVENAKQWKPHDPQPHTAAMRLPTITGYAQAAGMSPSGSVTGDTWESMMNLTAREYHTAVWTGNEMIVWGGQGGLNNLPMNTGERYDPVTDRWMSISDVGAPSIRQNHTAVWTGSEMLVWGGWDGSIVLNTGGRYDPATDSWAGISTAGAPSRRRFHTAVWTGNEMIVWGGLSGSNFINTGGRYDPKNDSWEGVSATNAPTGRNQHTAVWTGSQMLVWGGYGGALVNTGGRYDPVNDSWASIATTDAPSGREKHTAVWTGSEMIVWGGYVGGSVNSYVNTGGRYDPANDTWVAISSLAPDGRIGHTAVWTGSEMIVWGGANDGNVFATGGRYDPIADKWYQVNSVTDPGMRVHHTAVWTGSEMIVWGGSDGVGYLDTGGRYNPVNDTWVATDASSSPSARIFHTAVWTGSEMIVWGGADDTIGILYSRIGGRYDPAMDSWLPTNTLAPVARWHHTAVWTGSEMIVWGGDYGNVNYFNTGGRYDPANDSWEVVSTTNVPNPRNHHTAVWTGSEMIVWGGNNSYSSFDTGGRYDPANDSWEAVSTTNAPSPRNQHTAVWTGSKMIVWGGSHNTGGLYDPVNDSWTATSTTNAPDARYLSSAVWTGSKMIIWGGIIGSNYLDTGGLYDPTNDSWTATSTTDVPEGHVSLSTVWTGSEMIVWGGIITGGFYVNTGGRYDPASNSWTATSTTNAPDGRVFHTAVWTGREMIVWGGDAIATDGYGNIAVSRNTGGIYYPYSSFTIGGTVSGLAAGATLVLQNNGGDDLSITADGNFTFTSDLLDGSSYEVTVLSQPTSPNHTCTVSNGSGIVAGSDVTNVSVTCEVDPLFADVAPGYWAYDWIQTLGLSGITGGCDANNYCPSDPVSRAQMAVFLGRGIHGSAYAPPVASGTVFTDVPASYWAADWIESLQADGVTGGCDVNNYCPDAIVSRAQMAVFLLRSEHGANYVPPAATGSMFADVPASYWAASWIEQLANEGITGGCDANNYCPDADVQRDQMAVFLVKTFGL